MTLWRASDQAVIGELRGPCGNLDSLAFSHDGRLVAATGNARETVVWNVATRKIVQLLGPAGPMGNAGVNFSPDDKLIGTAGVDGNLRIYDLRTGRIVGSAPVQGSLQDLDFSPDGTLVAAAGLDWRHRDLERAAATTRAHDPPQGRDPLDPLLARRQGDRDRRPARQRRLLGSDHRSAGRDARSAARTGTC